MGITQVRIVAPVAVALLLATSACGSDNGEVDATESTDTTVLVEPTDEADVIGEAEFIVEADAACDEARKAFDGLLAESSDPTENPQPVVQGIADHFRQLHDELTALEGLDSATITATESYVAAVDAAATEAEEAAASEEQATDYLVAHSAALDTVNEAGEALGITSCHLKFEPTS